MSDAVGRKQLFHSLNIALVEGSLNDPAENGIWFPGWLPAEFQRTLESGGMGKGIANWLLYRETEGTLSLAALVMPPGVATPVHDHLAWGLVGLYTGEQDEEVYEAAALVGADDLLANLRLASKNHLVVGSFYELIPPHGDIHRVITTGDQPSISLHLLANDIGCVSRHIFKPETGEVIPFLSNFSKCFSTVRVLSTRSRAISRFDFP